MSAAQPALEWRTSTWFNTDKPLTLASLRGRVVVLHTFQMLCPGCAIHALPQAQRIHRFFKPQDVAVVGLHTVFEHHQAMGPGALSAFLHEYRYTFPVGVDLPRPGADVPHTMAAYGLRGTPSMVLIDRAGRLRTHHFGRQDDLEIGAQIMALVVEGNTPSDQARRPPKAAAGDCADGACAA